MEAEIKPLTKLIDALTARTRFGELMDEVDADQVRFVVSRRGKEIFLSTAISPPGFWGHIGCRQSSRAGQ